MRPVMSRALICHTKDGDGVSFDRRPALPATDCLPVRREVDQPPITRRFIAQDSMRPSHFFPIPVFFCNDKRHQMDLIFSAT